MDLKQWKTMEGGFVKVGGERKRDLGIRVSGFRNGVKRAIGDIFWTFLGFWRRGRASGGGRQMLRFQTKEARMGF